MLRDWPSAGFHCEQNVPIFFGSDVPRCLKKEEEKRGEIGEKMGHNRPKLAQKSLK